MKQSHASTGAASTVVGEVVLKFLEGENEGVEIRVSPPRELTIGRSEECDIFLGEKKISRKHCRILVSKETVVVNDLNSTNGTYVNGKKITECPVEDSDKVRVGSSVIAVAVHGEETAALAEEAPTRTVLDVSSSERAESEDHEASPSGAHDALAEESFSLDFDGESQKAPAAKPLAGSLSAMGLADLLQNLSQNRKRGVLKLRSQASGDIIMFDGKLMAASTGRLQGSRAVHRMLGWNEGDFEFQSLPDDFEPESVEKPVTESIETLLMEGFRQFDELQRIRKGLPKPEAMLKLKPAFSAPLSKLHPRVLDVLQVILNEGQFSEVLDASPFSDLETSKIVFYLLKKEYVVAQ